MTAPTVSVLMPVFNPHPVYFPQAVASIVAQSFTDWELVIVEDPSELSAAELLKPFDDPRIRLIRNPERTGFARQLNRGLDECRGVWVARFDADDICLPHRLASQLEYLDRHPGTDVLGAQIEVMDAAGVSIGRRTYPLDHAAILGAMTRFNPVAHPVVVFRKSAVVASGGYRATNFPGVEDYELWCRLAKGGATFATHPDVLLRYRLHTQAMKATRLRETIRGSIWVKREYWSGSLGLGGRLRLLAERLLLGCPASAIFCIFKLSQLSRRKVLNPRRPSLVPPGA